MLGKLAEFISAEYLTGWLIALLLFGYLAYKEWPEFRARVSSVAIRERRLEETDATLAGKIGRIEEGLEEINDKLDRDYRRLNDLERWQRQEEALSERLERELALMMRGMFACLEGLQQLGANGETTKIKDELSDFLIKTTHGKGEDKHE